MACTAYALLEAHGFGERERWVTRRGPGFGQEVRVGQLRGLAAVTARLGRVAVGFVRVREEIHGRRRRGGGAGAREYVNITCAHVQADGLPGVAETPSAWRGSGSRGQRTQEGREWQCAV